MAKIGSTTSFSKQLKLTKGSKRVLESLATSTKLATAQDIHSQLREAGDNPPGLTTVYRALEALVAQGLVQAVELGDGEKRFELVEPGHHHHHLVCERCKNSVHLDQCMVEEFDSAIRTKYGFEITTHILELFGICKNCRGKKKT